MINYIHEDRDTSPFYVNAKKHFANYSVCSANGNGDFLKKVDSSKISIAAVDISFNNSFTVGIFNKLVKAHNQEGIKIFPFPVMSSEFYHIMNCERYGILSRLGSLYISVLKSKYNYKSFPPINGETTQQYFEGYCKAFAGNYLISCAKAHGTDKIRFYDYDCNCGFVCQLEDIAVNDKIESYYIEYPVSKAISYDEDEIIDIVNSLVDVMNYEFIQNKVTTPLLNRLTGG